MGQGIFRGAGGDENLKINFMWPNKEICKTETKKL
jgi:hypothetical protein